MRTKAGPRRFEAIFIGYKENHIGWMVRDLHGRVHFSRDVIFNEDLSGRLGVPRSVSPRVRTASVSSNDRPVCTRIQTVAGRDYDTALKLKRARALERATAKAMSASSISHGGVSSMSVVAQCEDISHDTLMDLVSYLATSAFPDPIETDFLLSCEPDIIRTHCLSAHSRLFSSTSSDLSKEPISYNDAIARPDADAWRAAMEREKTSLA